MTSRGRSGGAKKRFDQGEMEKKRGKLHSYNKTPDKGIVCQEVIVVKIFDLPNLDLFSTKELMNK